jgi:UDP-glucose 4-epimerase
MDADRIEQAFAGKDVLITGGAGFIGSHLVEGLLRLDVRQVRVLDNFANGKRANLAAVAGDHRLVVLEQSVLDERAVAQACREAMVVFHLACLGVRHSLHAPLLNHRVNAEGRCKRWKRRGERVCSALSTSPLPRSTARPAIRRWTRIIRPGR